MNVRPQNADGATPAPATVGAPVVEVPSPQAPEAGLYVQYGCGFSAAEGWLNFDASPTLRFERIPLLGRLHTRNSQRFPDAVRYGDIAKGLPLPSASCAGVYASHVLEHLSLQEFHAALAETARLLAPGGIFRLVVPDLEVICRTYLREADEGSPLAGERLIRGLQMGRESRRRGLAGFMIDWLGNSHHQWMWDEQGLRMHLARHSFVNIRRATFGDSDDAMFARVEAEDRFHGACAMEARAPQIGLS